MKNGKKTRYASRKLELDKTTYKDIDKINKKEIVINQHDYAKQMEVCSYKNHSILYKPENNRSA